MPPPDDVDAHPAGASWAGVQDLVGNIYQVKNLHKTRFTLGAEDVILIVWMNKTMVMAWIEKSFLVLCYLRLLVRPYIRPTKSI